MKLPAMPLVPAHRIKIERKRLGKTQAQMADACGASREMWGRYERGAFPLSASVFRAFVAEGADSVFLCHGTREPGAGGPSVHDLLATPDQADALLALLQAALAQGTHLARDGLHQPLLLTDAELALVRSYRAAGQARKAVFDAMVLAGQAAKND